MKKLKYINGEMVEYEILKLVDKYDPILKTPTEKIDFETMKPKDVAYMSMSLMESLNLYNGLGLAANQVGLKYSMFALNVGKQIWCLINPVIIESSSDKTTFKEGCLSFPGLFLNVGRPSSVTVDFRTPNGQTMQQKFDGLTATVVQHEIDHLNGICFTDKVSPVVLNREKAKIKQNMKKLKARTSVTA